MLYSICFVCLVLFEITAALASPTSRKVSIVTGANGYLGREIVHNLLGNRIPIDDNNDCNGKIICLVRLRRVEEEKKYWDSVAEKGGRDVTVMPYDMLDGGATLLDALDHAFVDAGDMVIGTDTDVRDVGVKTECCVYHLASVFSPVEDHRQMALDNVKGAEDVIKAIAKLPSRNTKVVFTSSMAAVRGSGQTPRNKKWYTHEDWNTVSELGVNWGSSYQWSKAESEKVILEHV